jgi:hypothetical protein
MEPSYILYSTKKAKLPNRSIKLDVETLNNYALEPVESMLYRRLISNTIHQKFNVKIPKKIINSKLFPNRKPQYKESESGVQTAEMDDENQMINIIFMPELTKSQLKLYLDTYNDEPDNIKKYAEYLGTISYNQIAPNRFQVKRKLEKLLDEQSMFWEDEYNCNFSINNVFNTREFNNDFSKKKIDDNIKQKIESNVNKLRSTKKPLDVKELNPWEKNYCDGKDYWTSKQCSLTPEEITEIYKQIPTEYLQYNFLTTILCSRVHCHLFLNNQSLMEITKPIINKYIGVFKYLIGYAWLTLRQEEMTNRYYIKDNDRIIFNIETASLLPVFPFAYDDINQNPYACVLIDKNLMNLKENCVSLEMISENYTKYYGLTDKDTFVKRLNIFVNGTNKRGILDKIDWSKFAITGSAMTACAMKFNPLMHMYKTTNTGDILDISDNDFSTYLFHYYNKSDIDLICTHTCKYDFLNSVDKFIKDLEFESKTPLNCSAVHTASIILSDEFINNELIYIQMKFVHLLDKVSIDVDWVKNNFTNVELKQYFYDKYYIPWKENQIQEIKKLNIPFETYTYLEYLKAIPVEELRLYKLDYEIDKNSHGNNNWDKYIYNESNKMICKLSESIRFQLKSNLINRSWEIFRSANDNIFSTVGKFHMGFVRACYNGSTLLCTPSFISSVMLQLSVDYKYFASVRDPIEIINKYRSRGFGIILNDYEKMHMGYYNGVKIVGEENKWYDMYKCDFNDVESIKKIFGPKKITDNIFKPSKFFEGLTDDCFKNVNFPTFSNASDAFKTLYTNKTAHLYNYKAIQDNGFVKPLDKTFIKNAWDLINQA